MICDKCKKFFIAGNRPDGLPNGIKMILKGNKSITLCAQCVSDFGAMDDKQRDKTLKELKEQAGAEDA